MFAYKIILFMFYVTLTQCRLPDKVHCVDEKCNRKYGSLMSSGFVKNQNSK